MGLVVIQDPDSIHDAETFTMTTVNQRPAEVDRWQECKQSAAVDGHWNTLCCDRDPAPLNLKDEDASEEMYQHGCHCRALVIYVHFENSPPINRAIGLTVVYGFLTYLC